jgi:hypothetical protein
MGPSISTKGMIVAEVLMSSSPTPLKMNLVPEIRMDRKRNLETLPSTLPPFPKSILPQYGDSIAPCTS